MASVVVRVAGAEGSGCCGGRVFFRGDENVLELVVTVV